MKRAKLLRHHSTTTRKENFKVNQFKMSGRGKKSSKKSKSSGKSTSRSSKAGLQCKFFFLAHIFLFFHINIIVIHEYNFFDIN
jgi:hypothetical protein